ncbi:methionine ABC transporter ATP-binding protein [Actinophytocola algeriensis]|uniref:D-methionine transport system ATP-binding protein n=1 Tax=Actinophytocola algeriensis TaxID=1768010 RepID=A0A7W7QCT4_9PSEU|nr:ATP-binding cassette domain-containing protein [Actinophytocola algeriensis]MBB4911199.1 D-methionine transport system ATP-binding protein [Actinophytocola algeriensis]MBE1479138.1 D-methionine transport system ATP-binding protein [Actinophytocola algeriensis]
MITVENLTKSFRSTTGAVVALNDVSLDVQAGVIAGVVGPARAGKSTLARVLALRERPDSGTFRLDGLNTAALDQRSLRAARARIGVVPAGESLLAQRTAAGNIALPLEQAGVDGPRRREKVGKLLDLIGLTNQAATYPDQLSAGQRQRVAIARALVGEPTVVLADDPTGGLDATGSAGVLAVLDRARAELGATVLVATPDASVVRKIADDVAFLEDGRIVEHGRLLDLVQDPGSRVAQSVLPAIETSAPGVADIVLVGFASIGGLLPEAASRFGAEIAVSGGGVTKIGETPVARFRIGITGDQVDVVLGWLSVRGAHVQRALGRPLAVAAA